MNQQTHDSRDPILVALDRLAGVADAHPVTDRMPAIHRRARADRRRRNALATGGVAAVVALGLGVGGVLGGEPDAGRDLGPAGTPTGAPSTGPSASPSETPTPSSPASPSSPSVTGGGTLPPTSVQAVVEADVDGDGSPDTVEVLVPRSTEEGNPADRGWVRVTFASGETRLVEVSSEPNFFDLGDPVDIDGDGASELLATYGGGDGLLAQVYTWDGNDLALARIADPIEGIAGTDELASSAEYSGFSVQDSRLLSWRLPGYAQGQEATIWRWQLDGTRLSAERLAGTQCVSQGVIAPC